MQVILIENIMNLGKIGDQVEVKNGFARNYLLRQGKALRASKENVEFVSKKKVELNKKNEDAKNQFNEIASKICNNLQKKETTHLVTTNEKAKSINYSELEKIDADNFLFEARTTGNWGDSSYPNDNQINLKIGAEIIFIKNDTDKDYFNGEKGVVESLNNNNVIIKKNKSDTIIVEFATWEKIKYVYNSETNKLETEVIGTFSQLPLKLGWAITIHRSQGMTLDHVSIDLNMNFFAKSLIYVALSRVREFSDIYISNGNFNLDLFSLPDQRVIRFMKMFGFLNA